MAKTIIVRLKEDPYKIIVGNRILSQLGGVLRPLEIGRDAMIITNAAIQRRYGKSIATGLKAKGFSVKFLQVPDGEKSKSMQYAFQLFKKIAAYDVQKQSFIIALGGGVIGDLAGYVAAAYKRGIPYIQVPTTLLAQIDSAIGGKVGVDLPSGKNLVGAFYQPKLVYSDVAVLKTLPQRQIKNGLAEAVKYGIIADRKFFDYLAENYQRILSGQTQALENVVTQCSRIKASVVVRDEKETKGLRMILNFGHTTGHAIEAAGKYKSYQHGEAVALGMRVAADLSFRLGLLKEQDLQSIEELLTHLDLPSTIKRVRLSQIMRCMEHDKKFKGKTNRFVLASRIGSVQIVENVSRQLIQKSIRCFLA